MASAMDSQPTTPPDSRSRAPSVRNGEGPKMKGTCDRCALSKVKCDRQLPHCARCVAIGEDLGIPPPCHYTVSLRSLRKSSKKEKQGDSASKKQKAKSRHVRSDTLSTFSGDGEEALHSAKQSPDACRPVINHDISYDRSPFFDLDAKMELTTEPGNYLAPAAQSIGKNPLLDVSENMLYPDFIPRNYSCSTATSTMGDEYLSGISSVAPELGTLPEHKPRRPSCAELICSTVHQLWQASRKSTCNTGTSMIPQALDEALVLNRSASETVSTVLNCSCSLDPEFGFRAAFLLHSLMGFFRTIVQNAVPFRQPNGHPFQQSTEDMQFLAGPNPALVATASPPMRLGAYQMDAEDEHRFKLTLLRNEVSKISRLIDEFVAKYCPSWAGSLDEVVQPPQSEMLKYCLTMELKQCLDELDARAACL